MVLFIQSKVLCELETLLQCELRASVEINFAIHLDSYFSLFLTTPTFKGSEHPVKCRDRRTGRKTGRDIPRRTISIIFILWNLSRLFFAVECQQTYGTYVGNLIINDNIYSELMLLNE